jgi:hypothetical protein
LSRLSTFAHASWADPVAPTLAADATVALEAGSVLFLPNLRFVVDRDEQAIFSPSILTSSKNTSFDPRSGRVGGTKLAGDEQAHLARIMSRFSDSAHVLVNELFPRYRDHLMRARASFRPAEIAGRQTSWRKDDTRLHIDAFPSNPMHGTRLLRVFCNVNPNGAPREWRVGEPFPAHARRYLASITRPLPGAATLMRAIGVTKRRRTEYDHVMLQLHDHAKADLEFQKSAPQARVDFAPGTTWVVYSDQVLHAAMGGQHMMEQTFYLAPEHQHRPEASPLGILERLAGRSLR